ncbi:MAG: hypothetical protein II719_00390 [Clostridia bacterium]|nr:hypothetical protein [Clostridia bacterium]
MIHCILAKFRPDFLWRDRLAEIRAVFEPLVPDTVRPVRILPCCVDRGNRYSVAILLELDRDALERYDASEPHRLWKETYGPFLESKAIFDCEPDFPETDENLGFHIG